MNSPSGEWWKILQDNHLRRPPQNELSHAVSHSIGRGNFKDLAREVVVPELVLDKIIQSNSNYWSDEPCGGPGRRRFPAGDGGTVATADRSRMLGVRVDVESRVKKSGRATLLRTRRSQHLRSRTPGNLASAGDTWSQNVLLLEKEQPEQQPGTHHHLERSVSPDVHHHLERSVGPDVSGSLTALTRCGLGGPGRAGDSGLCSPHSSIASLKSNSSSPAAISENKRGRNKKQKQQPADHVLSPCQQF